ncbi:MAG: hypothetical protein JWN75_7 [Candidatus Saccharibacteria bacterium]|nr:hypothetical protein [Candidatus Saccharibacteria bacterium]
MRSRTFQIIVRAIIAMSGIASYLLVSRAVVLGMVLSLDKPYKGWLKEVPNPDFDSSYQSYTDSYTLIDTTPSFGNLQMASVIEWICGYVLGILAWIVLALIVYGFIQLIKLVVFGRKAFPSCSIRHCQCAHHIAYDERNKRWGEYATAASIGAAIGIIASQ